MSEVKIDSAIKLFGKTISLPPPPPAPEKVVSDDDVSLSEQRHSCLASSTSQDSKDESIGDCEEKWTSSNMSSDDGKKEDDKGLKKPDKIIPCPRCSSMDTKFCYFNNYNVNQPRHFCKKCQRYWTSGGTMRNVPIGSGRRKTKNALLPNYHRMMVSHSDTLSSSFKSNTFLVGPHAFPISFYPTTLCWGSGNHNPQSLSLLEPIEDSMPGPSPPPVLGKHPREGRENHNGVSMLKTLRIHDPIEAAKSSIWSTLGINNDGVRLFKGFQSKGDRRQSVDQRKLLLQANPAAFSRSLNFHERA